MKKRIALLASFALLLSVSAALGDGAAAKPKAPYLKDFSEALKAADAKGQYVLIDFYTDW